MALTSAFAVALGAASSAALAESADVDPFSLSPEQLFDATVTSVSKTSEKLGDAPAAAYVLTADDIKRLGATSIAEALRAVPGVEVIRANSSSWGISIRGFNTGLANKLLVLIDGREVYDPLFSGVYWDVQDTALEDIERIEVIRGPGGTLWGANAVNGVINIITKNAAKTNGAFVSVVAGDEDRAIVTGRHGAKADNVSWRVYGKYLDRADHDLASGASARDAWQSWRTGFRADWDKTPGGDTFTVQGDAYTVDSGKLRAVPRLTAPYAVAFKEHDWAEGGNLLGRWTRDLDGGAQFSLQAYVDVAARGQFTVKDRRTSFDVDAQMNFAKWDEHEVITGLRYRVSDSRLTASPVTTILQPERVDQLVSGFIQDKITLDPGRWFLTVGTKLEHNDASGFEIQPSARIQWSGDDQETAWAAVSRAVRTPSWLEQDLTIVTRVIPPGVRPVQVQLVPSPDFDSEELVAYEAGYRRQWTPTLLTDVALFYNDYDELATMMALPPFVGPTPPPHFVAPFKIANFTGGKTFGGELVVSWRAADNLNLAAAYSVIEVQLTDPSRNQALGSEASETQAPQQQFNLRAEWNVADDLALDSTLYYVDAVPAFAIDAYWRTDIRAGWKLTDAFELELVGQDIFDATGSDANGAEVGRSVFGRLTWRS